MSFPAAGETTSWARQWTAAGAPDDSVLRFRRIFGLVWLTYDVLDLALGGTDGSLHVLTDGRTPALMAIQAGLILAESGMVMGRPSSGHLFAGLSAVLRGFALAFFPVNDFFYFTVVAVLLAVPGNPRWRRDVLLAQTAWIYGATAVLKLTDVWLSGGHLFVRFGYLWDGLGWPHLASLRACTESLRCLSVVAWGAVLAELALATLLITRRAPRLAIALAVGIHLFAALALNVWFFGASMIAQVACLAMGRRGMDPLTGR